MQSIMHQKKDGFNMLITQNCNKGCSFCFAGEKTDNDMTVEFATSLIERYPEVGEVAVLGGEPTIATHFKEIMEMLYYKGIKIKLISNLLCDDETIDWLINFSQSGAPVHILANAMDLSKNTMPKFIKNFGKLTEHAFRVRPDGSNGIALAFTLAQHYKPDHFKEYAQKLLDSGLPKRYAMIRVGIDLTGEWILNNKQLGKQIEDLFDVLCLPTNTNLSFDCKIPPCIFDFTNPKIRHIMDKRVRLGSNIHQAQRKHRGEKFISGCLHPVTDINYKGEAFYCYPTQAITTVPDVKEFKTMQSLKDELSKKYMDNIYDNNKLLPDTCRNCPDFGKICNGLCLGCYRN